MTEDIEELRSDVEDAVHQIASEHDIHIERVILQQTATSSDIEVVLVSSDWDGTSQQERPRPFYMEWPYDELPEPDLRTYTPSEYDDKLDDDLTEKQLAVAFELSDEDTAPEDVEADSPEDIEVPGDAEELEIDDSHITEHPPSVDIDQYVEDCGFRIERMSKDSLWVAAYTKDDEPDHHYNFYIVDDGMRVTHRRE